MKNDNKYIKVIMILFLTIFGFKTIVLADSDLDCTAWGATLQDFQNIFDFCKIVVPLLVIGLSTFDFIKAVAGKDDKDMKKSFSKLMKRLALAVVFFFLPVILNLFLELMETNTEVCVSVD